MTDTRTDTAVTPAERDAKTREVTMRMLAYIVLAGTTILEVAPAMAERYDPRFPVCMQRSRSGRSSTLDCHFTSMDQCRMTASGLQARRPSGLRPRCFPNPNYRG